MLLASTLDVMLGMQLLLLLSFSCVVNVPAAQHNTCMISNHHHGHGSLDIATTGELLSNLRRHLIETLQLHLKLILPTHLGNEDLPFMEYALLLLLLLMMKSKVLVLPLFNGRSIGGGNEASWNCRSLG